jgi:hypothetical protein
MTTKRFKDFGLGGEIETTPLSFKLHDEEFNCRPSLQGKVLLSIVGAADSDDASAMSKMISGFFDVCLVDADRERFRNLLEDPDKIVSVETLGEIVGWLVEQYTARPTKQPEPSSSGQ